MSRRLTVSGTAVTTASPATVHAVLRDRPSWPSWSALGRYEFVSGTEGELDAVCTFVTRGIRSTERIVELVPERRLSYVLERGLPMRGYRADVDLTPEAGGTRITWTSSFEPKIPGTGWLFQRMMTKVLGDLTAALATYAASLAPR